MKATVSDYSPLGPAFPAKVHADSCQCLSARLERAESDLATALRLLEERTGELDRFAPRCQVCQSRSPLTVSGKCIDCRSALPKTGAVEVRPTYDYGIPCQHCGKRLYPSSNPGQCSCQDPPLPAAQGLSLVESWKLVDTIRAVSLRSGLALNTTEAFAIAKAVDAFFAARPPDAGEVERRIAEECIKAVKSQIVAHPSSQVGRDWNNALYNAIDAIAARFSLEAAGEGA